MQKSEAAQHRKSNWKSLLLVHDWSFIKLLIINVVKWPSVQNPSTDLAEIWL